jgi:glycosyltransferase involved in cell wall biosynthesis
MRVGVVVPGFSANAEDWCIPALRDFVGTLARTDEVRVFALRYPLTSSHYQVFGADVFACGGGLARRGESVDLWRRTIVTIAAEHRRARLDVIHAFWADETGLIAALTGRLLGVPTVVSPAGGELVAFRDIAYGGQLRIAERIKIDLALRLASTVTVGSGYERDLARRTVSRLRNNSPHLLPLGVNLDRFSPSPSESQSQTDRAFGATDVFPTVLNVASLVPVKDQSTLIAAAAIARDQGHPFHLELIGDGPQRPSLLAQVKSRGLGKLVRLPGSLPHDRLASAYRSAQLFGLSSRHEAQCLAALEAAGCERAVVGTDVGVIPDLASPGGAVVPRDPSRLAEAIMASLADDEQRQASEGAARAIVTAKFDVLGCTDRFRALYETLISSDGSGSKSR